MLTTNDFCRHGGDYERQRGAGCRLALVLAVDASGSVSNDWFELQKRGYPAAFRNRQILNSIRSLATQSIAVTVTQWPGPQLHFQTVDWTLAKDEASVNALADAIDASERQLAASPFLGVRRVTDVSGDGATIVGGR
jgi:Protein of unknown function (DUF1194)